MFVLRDDELLLEEDLRDDPPVKFTLVDSPVPGIPNVADDPRVPVLKENPLPPKDVLTPLFEKFTFTPLHIFILL